MGGVPREQKMLKGHLPRVIYITKYTSIRRHNTQKTERRQDKQKSTRDDLKVFFFSLLLSSLELSDAHVYEP